MTHSQDGNIFAMLFGAVAVVGTLGFATMQMISGPVTTMTRVNQKNMVDSNLLVSSKIAVMDASVQTDGGDCDGDGWVEPREWRGAVRATLNGGMLPDEVGATKLDPWGTEYGYCVWDHGPTQGDAGCDSDGDTVNDRFTGPTDNSSQPVLAIISAGADRVFQTVCSDWVDADADNNPDTPLIVPGGDDHVNTNSFDQAAALSPSLWKISSADANVVELATGKTADVRLSSSAAMSDATKCDAIEDVGRVRFDPLSDAIEVCNNTSGSWDWGPIGGEGAANAFAVDDSVIDCTEDINPADGTPDHLGEVRYNDTGAYVEYCDGTGWRKLITESATASLTITPTEVNNISISGAGNPAYSTTYNFIVENKGSLTSDSITASLGNTVDFEIATNDCAGTLDPGETCTVGVRARANTSKTFTGSLVINGNNNPMASLSGSANPSCPVNDPQAGGVVAACRENDYLIVTPAGCTNSTTPTCSGTSDIVTSNWGDDTTTHQGAISTNNGTANTALLSGLSGTFLTDYCNDMTYGGYDDWFLPSENELKLITTAIASGDLDGNAGDSYWSSTEHGTSGSNGRVVTDGSANNSGKSFNYYKRCARIDTATATASANPCEVGEEGAGGLYARCNVSGSDGTYHLITMPGNCDGTTLNPTCSGGSGDSYTVRWGDSGFLTGVATSATNGDQNTVNLMALAGYRGVTFNAAQYCNDMSYNGYTDWYLPAAQEVRDVEAAGLISTGQWHWSSTENQTNRACFVGGSIHCNHDYGDKWDTLHLRCVRREDLPLPSVTHDTNPEDFNVRLRTVTYTSGSTENLTLGTVDGISTTINLSVSGDGSPAIILNSSNEGASTTADYGDTLAIRATAPTTLGDEHTVTINVGTDTYTWNIGYADSSLTKRVFVTNTTYSSGDFNGNVDGACQTAAANAGFGGTWKAIVGLTTQHGYDLIPWNWGTVKNMNGLTVANSFEDLWDGSITNPINVTELGDTVTKNVYAALNADGTANIGGDHRACDNWDSNWSGIDYYYGSSGATGSTWIKSGAYNGCGDDAGLYCIESEDAGDDLSPKDFSFKLEAATASTRVESETITISGASPGANLTVILTGSDGSPMFKVNGGSETASGGTIQNGDTLAIVMDAPSDEGDIHRVDVKVGNGNEASFYVVSRLSSTKTKRVFVTSTVQDTGNFGGVGGANGICQNLADNADLGGIWQAILSASQNESDAIRGTLSYDWTELRLIDGTLVVDDPEKLWDTANAALSAGIDVDENGNKVSTNMTVYTNTNDRGGVGYYDTSTNWEAACRDWTINGDSDYKDYRWGSVGSASTSWVNAGWQDDCNADRRLYCLEKATTLASGVPTLPRSCKDAKLYGFVPDGGGSVGDSGLYTIDPDEDGAYSSFQAYCDMTTSGGPWTLVLNYVHQTGTDPSTNARGLDLPLLNSNVLGDDESGTNYWGHATPTLLDTFKNNDQLKKVRFECSTSNHSRKMNFYTTQSDCIDYITTGTDTSSQECEHVNSSHTLLIGHTANLPNTADGHFYNKGVNALTNVPFYDNSTSHWSISGDDWSPGNHWACDDDDPGQPDTIHRVWIN